MKGLRLLEVEQDGFRLELYAEGRGVVGYRLFDEEYLPGPDLPVFENSYFPVPRGVDPAVAVLEHLSAEPEVDDDFIFDEYTDEQFAWAHDRAEDLGYLAAELQTQRAAFERTSR